MDNVHLAIVIGSTREGRFGPVVANWFADHARHRSDLVVDLVDLADEDVRLGSRIGRADAIVVVTPEYNHAYPAPLKAAIDSLKKEWIAKPIGFVSYGGISGGLRAVEQLRQVFAELHAVTIRDTVSFHGAWARFEDDGSPKEVELVAGAANVLLDELVWWALALRDAKATMPYPAA